MLTASELKTLLNAQGVRLTKRLGQHYLVDARTITRFLDGCRLSASDTVVELGAGLGALTEGLAARAGRVVAVEVDPRVCRLLAERMASFTNVTVAYEDILTISWERHRDVIVVGAIPYHITSPILVSLCEARSRIRGVWLIIQQEVADRLTAMPSAKAYGRLSVLAQYGWTVRQVLPISRRAFFPPPNVDSCAVHLAPRERPAAAVADERGFFAFVKAAFAHRRKTLANCLTAAGMKRTSVEACLHAMGLPKTVRGEALSIEQLAALHQILGQGPAAV